MNMICNTNMKKKWWHDKVAYQIYPKSFLDTNGDGIGDLRGIISKLDYLKELGIDIIWLSPIYKSPFVDQGYDISDYYAIAEEFGTMEEFDELLAETKKRGMFIIMDLVINHCSDKHEWFQKALADPDGEYADYFFFREGKNGNLPSNYRSYFGGSCWEPVLGTNKYYFHMFAKEQPDLNWENPVLRQKLYDMINWWLEKGLGGFRIDAIINIKKDLTFPDFEPDADDGLASCWKMVQHVNGIGDYLEDMKKHTFEKYDAFTVAEVFNMKDDELGDFIGDNGHFSTIFDFSASCLSDGEHGWYDAPDINFKDWRRTIIDSQLHIQKYGFEANIIENHDEPRGVSRFLPAYARTPDGIKMLGTINILLRGIPFIYQGQEIGMQNAKWNSIDEFDDISTKDQYQVAKEAGLSDASALEACSKMSRDNARTPMQWTDGENAGFTTGTPWLKVNSNYTDINVKNQEADANSILNYYRKLVALRKSVEYKNVFTYGEFAPVYDDTENIMAFYRRMENDKCVLVAGNFGKEPVTVTLEFPVTRILLSNKGKEQDDALTQQGTLTLDSCEVIVLECECTNMNQNERRDAGLAYIADNAVFEEMQKCKRILQKLNFIDRCDADGISKLVKELFGKSEGAFVNPPFFCDYGSHIEVGKNFFANYNCTMLDVAKIKIGDNCLLAPNVAIYTAGHPVHPVSRNSAYEYGKEVTIGDNVWLGGNTVVCPGVHIGNNVVIGAGSVVTKDISDWSIAAGNPCKVIRKITDDDRRYLFRHEEFDDEAWADITSRMTF